MSDHLLSEEKTIEVKTAPDVKVVNRTQIIEIDPATSAVHVRDAGPVGPPGKDAVGAEPLYFESPGAVSVWEIEHPYDHNPSVDVYFANGTYIDMLPKTFLPGKVIIDISPLSYVLRAQLRP